MPASLNRISFLLRGSCRARFIMLRVAVTNECLPHSTWTLSIMSRLYHRLSLGYPADMNTNYDSYMENLAI